MDASFLNEITSVGNAKIDSQHQHFMSLLNGLSDDNADSLESIIDELVQYINYHFDTEEALLGKANYPHLKEHQGLHAALVGQVAEMLGKLHERNLEINEVKQQLTQWYLNHICIEDMKFKEYM